MKSHKIFAPFCAILLTLALAFPALAAETHSVRITLPAMLDVFVDGTKVDFLVSNEGKYPPFSYDGTVYIPLMTVGRWLGADTVWDEKSETVAITSNGAEPIYDTVIGLLGQGVGFQWGDSQYDEDRGKGVEAQVLSNATVTLNGKVQSLAKADGNPAYPLSIRGFIYLPIESVGAWLGKEVLQYGGNLYLYQTSMEELTQAKTSLATIHSHLDAVRAVITGTAPTSEAEFATKAKETQSHLMAAYALPAPAFQGLKYDWKDLHYWLELTLTKLVDGYLPAEESSGVGEPARPAFLSDPHTTVQDKWERFSGGIVPAPGYSSYFLYAEEQCSKMEQLLTAIDKSPIHSPSTEEMLPIVENIPASGTAYASTQPVLVNGTAVEFQCYALKDTKGNDTNYVKLRDVASILNGTAVQFNVGWDGTVNIETEKAYTPNGSEMFTPFSGDRVYKSAGAETRVDGRGVSLNAIVLTDDQGGAYTYYKLRDLGMILGFQVGWNSQSGIYIETE